MILADHEIETLCAKDTPIPMISPFTRLKQSSGRLPSWGLSHFGYDVRLSDEFIRFLAPQPGGQLGRVLVPGEDVEDQTARILHAPNYILQPGTMVLACSMETLHMPSNVVGLVKDKSTYARLGVAVQNTVLEPGWRGQITLELTNHNSLPVNLIGGAGIAQVMFFRGETPISIYTGKYQDQKGVVLPK